MTRAAGGGRKGGDNLPAVANQHLLRKVPKAPDELMDDSARLIWQTQARVLIDRGLLTTDHLPLLMGYCNSFALMLKADAMLVDQTIIAATKEGFKKHPAMNVRQDAISCMVRIGSLLGLDPTSHRRLLGGGGGADPDNEFGEFR